MKLSVNIKIIPVKYTHIHTHTHTPIYSGYGKYSDPLKCFTLCYIAAIC